MSVGKPHFQITLAVIDSRNHPTIYLYFPLFTIFCFLICTIQWYLLNVNLKQGLCHCHAMVTVALENQQLHICMGHSLGLQCQTSETPAAIAAIELQFMHVISKVRLSLTLRTGAWQDKRQNSITGNVNNQFNNGFRVASQYKGQGTQSLLISPV